MLGNVEAGAEPSALAIVKRVLVAHEAAPIDDMEQLVRLAQADSAFREELLRGTIEVLDADPASLVPCWLSLIVGELGRPAFGPLLAALGTSEGQALDETILPVLTRHAVSAFEAITHAIEDAAPEDDGYRADLYGVLTAVALAPGDAPREELRRFVLRRVEAWRSGAAPLESEAEVAALGALVRRVAPEIVAATEWAGPASRETALDRQMAAVSRVLAESWRDTAREIERRHRSGAGTEPYGERQW